MWKRIFSLLRVPVYPLDAWDLCPGAWDPDKLNPDFLVINFDPPVPRGPVDLLHPGHEMSFTRHCLPPDNKQENFHYFLFNKEHSKNGTVEPGEGSCIDFVLFY
ncbi:hypothetical protein TNCV_1099221 [Trichonephila clavipes]|nr:hypothetical protein TNCV_1099221 [Trichonephila clavipes]